MSLEQQTPKDGQRSDPSGSGVPGSRLRRPELVVALVGALGTPMTEVMTLLRTSFSRFQYTATDVRLIRECLDGAGPRFWKKVWELYDAENPTERDRPDCWVYSGNKEAPPPDDVAEHIRRKVYMDAGKVARQDFKAYKERSRAFEEEGRDTGADVLAWLGINRIRKVRRDENEERRRADGQGGARERRRQDLDQPLAGHVFIIRSLKNQEEVYLLQRVYGPGFFVVGLYSSEHTRRIATEGQLQGGLRDTTAVKPVADYLINRDFHESTHDQNVRDTFGLADLFLDTDRRESMSVEIDRFLDLLFSRSDVTPTRIEYGMALAHIAAATSGALPRQVGAAITTTDGEVVSLGRNEVPHPKGGLLYTEDMGSWGHIRDLNSPRRRDTSHDIKKEQIGKAVDGLRRAELIDDVGGDKARPVLERSALVRDVIEFHPELHAEMSAIVSAARRGASVAECRLFCTAYPCHNCARLIMGAGIREVFYIEAYPKSRAKELYNDGFGTTNGVKTAPFVGIAPRRYRDLFSLSNSEGDVIERRSTDGEVFAWSAETARFRWRTWAAGFTGYEALIEQSVEAFQNEIGEKDEEEHHEVPNA